MGVLTTTGLDVGFGTDVGCVRELNEDALLVHQPLFVVADGMGGHAAGEVASAIAVEHLATLAGRPDVSTDDLLAAVEQANSAIVAQAQSDPGAAGMGTTVTGLCLGTVGGSPHWYVFNVGDSRVYRVGSGSAVQLTVDHSEVGELLAAGRISPAEAAVHPLRNVVTRSLGTDPGPTADLWVLPAEAGDVFVICSDGLTNEVSDDEIAGAVAAAAGAQEATDALVSLALAAGGRDNVSVIVVSSSAPSSPPPLDTAAEITAPRATTRGVTR